jgi:UDP-galactopyranose mutase
MGIDWIVVGAGFTGATFAERMATAGRRVLIVDRRAHIGGNAHDETNEHAILVHRYGPHIFHTNSEAVWRYLGKFTDWRAYEHHVLGLVEGKLVPIPFNLDSLAALFPRKAAARIESALINQYGFGKRVPILKLRISEQPEIRDFADYVYRNVFEGYTRKQWQLRPEELSASVTARVPVSISRDARYFQDIFQAIPLRGYTEMFRRMLEHPNIVVALNYDWKRSMFKAATPARCSPEPSMSSWIIASGPYPIAAFASRSARCRSPGTRRLEPSTTPMTTTSRESRNRKSSLPSGRQLRP